MEKIYWLISVPNKTPTDTQPFSLLDSRTAKDGLSKNAIFRIPDLKFGTLDTLMTLVDELFKYDTYVESVVKKIIRLWSEELKEKDNELTLEGGASVDLWLRNFDWKEEKYPVRSPLKTLAEQIHTYVAKIEEELRGKSTEYTTLTHNIAAADRKATGNMMIRDLTDLIKNKMSDRTQFPDSEFMTTLLVAVNKFNDRDWLNQYETLCDFVVPRSTMLIDEDQDYRLYSVVLFRRAIDTFKNEARQRRFTVRDFKFEDTSTTTSVGEERQKLEQEKDKQKNALVRWCKTNFSEAFSAWIHLKAIRVFAESVLRYGLPPRFLTMLVQPNKKYEGKLRRLLAQLFNISGGDVATDEIDPGQDQFFPYVNITINLETKQA